MSKNQRYRRGISKDGRRWLMMMIVPGLMVIAGVAIMTLARQGQLAESPWAVSGMAIGATGALFASLLTLLEASMEA